MLAVIDQRQIVLPDINEVRMGLGRADPSELPVGTSAQ
jgi:hypothetical protein